MLSPSVQECVGAVIAHVSESASLSFSILICFLCKALSMCIHPLFIFHCGHHYFAPDPVSLCTRRDPHRMPYPTTRALNERLSERKAPPARPMSHRKHMSMIPSPPFSPRKALEQAKQSKLPLPASPTSAFSTPLRSPMHPPASPKKTVRLDVGRSKFIDDPRRPQVTRADDSWMKELGEGNAATKPRKASEIRATHAQQHFPVRSAQGTLSRIESETAARKQSELPDTLLRKHLVSRDNQAQSCSGSMSSIHTLKSPQRRSLESSVDTGKSSTTPVINPSAPRREVPRRRTSRLISSPAAPLRLIPSPTIAARSFNITDRSDEHEAPLEESQTLPGHTCEPKGHPYTSHFIPYLCAPCFDAAHKRERDRKQRLEQNLKDDVLVERVKLQEWQWKTRFNERKNVNAKERRDTLKTGDKATTKGVGEQRAATEGQEALTTVVESGKSKPILLQGLVSTKEQDEQQRLKEEAEMLVKMEEANRLIEQATKASRRQSADDKVSRQDRRSLMQGLRRSWGIEAGASNVKAVKPRASWRVSRWQGREEY